ncbi:MAG: DoxX family protein [Methylocystis sp.]|nr:DoxX family protein [Methylocystis sp.]
MTALDKLAEFTGRSFLAAIFLLSGLGKIGQYAGTQAYMDSAGVPGQLLPLVIALEVAGALVIVVGWQTRLIALALAGFSLIAAILFHANFQDQITMIMFLKNIGIAGGFLLLFANGAGAWSLDARRAAQSNA